jgi:hypothetical protein
MASVCELQVRLREISKIALEYRADYTPVPHFATEMRGYSDAEICVAVYKRMRPPEYARDQARFMEYLGTHICPKILMVYDGAYCMEYLYPAEHNFDSLVVLERLLEQHVWNRSLIHGDPTLDNVMMTKDGFLRLRDPIPKQWLRKPYIVAVDHGKILQSLLGWEVVLRGVPLHNYQWPKFMEYQDTARRAVFWAVVALKRIMHRDITDSATQWATRVSKELEDACNYPSGWTEQEVSGSWDQYP